MISPQSYALDRLESRLLLLAGQADTSFSGDGQLLYDFSNAIDEYDDYATAVAVQPDGKVIVAGHSNLSANGIPQAYHTIIRMNPSGSLDTSFGGGDGRLFLDGGRGARIAALALQDDGKIVAVGEVDSGDSITGVIMRFLSNGAPDPSFFGSDGRYIATSADGFTRFQDVKIDSQGRIVVTGGNAGFFVARITAAGAFDSTFDGNGKKVVLLPDGRAPFPAELDFMPDGDIVIGGRINDVLGGSADIVLARINPGGSLDSGFVGGGIARIDYSDGDNDSIQGIAVQPDGKILVAGVSSPSGPNQQALWRYNGNGTLDATFGGGDGVYFGEAGEYSDVLVQPTGRIVTLGGSNTFYRHHPNGFLDPGFAAVDFSGAADELIAYDDGRVMSVGDTSVTNNQWDYVIARVHAGTINVTATLDPYTTSGDDVIEVRRNGGNAEFYITNTIFPTLIVPVAETAGLALNMAGGNDVLRIYLDGGNPFLASGIDLDDGAGNDILSVYGSDGSDLLTSNTGSVGAGGALIHHNDPESVFLFGEGGNDLIAVNYSAAATTVFANGGSGNDTFGFGGGEVGNVAGRVRVQGESGDDRLVYDDANEAVSHDYRVTADDVTTSGRGVTIGVPLEYLTLESIDLSAGTGSNVVRVDSLGRVDGRFTFPVDVTVRGGAGNDDLVVGEGDLDVVLGAIDFVGGAGTDLLSIDDHSNASARTYTLQTGLFQRTGSDDISFTDAESFSLLAGTGADTIDLRSADGAVNVNAGGGDDQVTLGQGNLGTLAGAVTVAGGAGVDQLLLDDDNTFGVGFVHLITPTTVGRAFFGGLTYASVEVVELHAPNSNGTISVQGTAANSRLVLRPNNGNDSVVINETSPTGPVEIFPGVGNDSLDINPDNAGAAVVRINFLNAPFTSLNIGAGGDLRVAAGAGANGGALHAQTFTMNAAGRLDLADNALRVVTTGGTASQVLTLLNQRVASARNTGASGRWSGNGITSANARNDLSDSTGLVVVPGVGEAIVKYSWAADADGDEAVTADDFFLIDRGFLRRGTLFHEGNFNFNVRIDLEDYALLDSLFLALD